MEKINYKELLKRPEYEFLKTNEHLGDNIILLALGGSHAYGLNTPTSDLDIRGIAIEKPEEIIGYKTFEQFIEPNTDTTIYSFNKMVDLLMANNPNIVEILGLEPDQYLYISPLGQELLDNRDLFISQRCFHTFGGYARAQLKRVECALARDNYTDEMKNNHIAISLENAIDTFNQQHKSEVNPAFAYVDKENDNELRYKLDVDISANDFEDFYSTVSNTTRNYKELLNRNKKKDAGHLAKHMSHLVRLLNMCIEMLETGEVHTFRSWDHDLLMDIKNGKYMTAEGNISDEFYKLVADLEERFAKAKENTKLPKVADLNKIEQFVMKVNKNIINGVYEGQKFEIK